MMTKRQFCEMIVERFEIEEKKKATENDIYKCGRLAVALEYLGKIQQEYNKKYALSRGGILFVGKYNKKTKQTPMLSVRNILSLLPEK